MKKPLRTLIALSTLCLSTIVHTTIHAQCRASQYNDIVTWADQIKLHLGEHLEKIRTELHLSTTQQENIRLINERTLQKIETLRKENLAERAKLEKMFFHENVPSLDAVMPYYDSMTKLHAAIFKKRIEERIAILHVLNPEQRKKLHSLANSWMSPCVNIPN